MKNRRYHLKKLGMSGNVPNVDLLRNSLLRKKILKVSFKLQLIKKYQLLNSFLKIFYMNL